MFRRIPRILPAVSQGYRALRVTSAVHGERSSHTLITSAIHGERPPHAPSLELIRDEVASAVHGERPSHALITSAIHGERPPHAPSHALFRDEVASAVHERPHTPSHALIRDEVASAVHERPASSYGARLPACTYGARPSHALSLNEFTSRQRFVQLTSRRGISTCYTQQMMCYGPFDPNSKMLESPVDFYKRKGILHGVQNKLVTKSEAGESWIPIVTVFDDIAYSIRSLTGLIVDNHRKKIAVSKALQLDNLKMHIETGDYAFVTLDETNTSSLNSDTELEDFKALHDVIVLLLTGRHGTEVMDRIPWVLSDFLKKLLAEDLQVLHIIFHALFLPLHSKLLLRVLLDIKLRRPLGTGYCPFRIKIQNMLTDMPFTDNGKSLDSIIAANVFLNSLKEQSDIDQEKWAAEDEQMSQGRSKEEREWLLKIKIACWLIAIQRHAVLHFPKPKLPKESKHLLTGLDIRKVIHMLNAEFPDFEERVLELLAEKGLWDHVGATELFGKCGVRLQEVIERDKSRAAEKAEGAEKAGVDKEQG